MEVIAVTSDPCFNYFFSIGVEWAFPLGGLMAVFTLFRN
jgi:hypothetical protein